MTYKSILQLIKAKLIQQKKSFMYSFPLPLTVAFTLTFISNLMHISADKKKWLHMGKIEIIVNQS